MLKYGTTQSTRSQGPEVTIAVAANSTSAKHEVTAILDTGAVLTCIPEAIFQQIGPVTYDVIPARGVFGTSGLKVCEVSLSILACKFERVTVGVIELEYALIGRDFLNDYAISLNGPEKTWSVEDPCC